MEKRPDLTQVHCYTNPSFCIQSEYIPDDAQSVGSDLPPPPQFQVDDLPPPPAVHQPQPQYGQVNPAFNSSPEVAVPNRPPPLHRSVANLNHTTADRYCYIDDRVEAPSPPPPANAHKRYGSLPMGRPNPYAYRNNRYEYIQDDASVQVQVQVQPVPGHPQQQMPTVSANTSRYEYIQQQEVQQRAALSPQQQQQQMIVQQPQQQQMTPQQQQRQVLSRQNSVRASVRSYRNPDAHYQSLGPDSIEAQEARWNEEDKGMYNTSRRQIQTPRGRYTSVPMQDEDPPSLPERNQTLEVGSPRVNNLATQKLHEILTTPRKPRSRSQGDLLSPVKSPQNQQSMMHSVAPSQRNAYTPGCSPSSGVGQRAMNSPMQQPAQHSTPQSRALSPRGGGKGPTTSTPNKEPPSARRCLPLNESTPGPMVRRHIEDSQAAAYGRTPGHRYHMEVANDEVYVDHQKKAAQANGGFYPSVESAFIARTAVVPPLSPSMSEAANTTLVSGTEKGERKNAPLILALVGILTCGLAIYLSYTQGRRYYFDSAIGCGACCALAGACRSMRRTWTGLGLAGLSALSCAGLLLLAAKSPRPGTPLHDVTAGALCGVSVLGAALALLALAAPRCAFGRHRRVHSWIPRFQP
ncbi:ataxin-2 homolog [Nasonia vitripennis]|uniref:Uncharacterized protein n=1 Tax=Nasonia vitripennis TaxID=7425 RepID=A0A7M7H1U0_NASVI|nr:ataxin-2 homolog [Nasonia vitripennis]